MKHFTALLIVCALTLNATYGANLWTQDFSAGATGFYANSGMTRNAGGTYSCVSGNYLYYTSSTYAYFSTNTIAVPQGKGIKFSFDSRRLNASSGTIEIYYLITGACSWNRLTPNNNGWVLWSTITPNTSAGLATGCTNQSVQLESYICGGQNISVLMYFPNASSTNWISVDNLVIDDTGPVSVAVPVISGATTYTENITGSKWYGPVTTGNYATTGVVIPYHSYKSNSDAYTYLFTGGSGGTGNHSGNGADYFAAFYTGMEFCNSSGSSQIITKELNTSLCANPEIKFAYKAKYPCTAGDYAYTFDESYDLYAPKVFTSTGQGYTWVQQSVNYYFPDGLWHFATFSVPSATNLKIKFARGGSCASPVEGVDHLKVFCRDCSISTLTAGTITGESAPSPSTDYSYSITPTTGAVYYKWMIRANDRTPPVLIDAACPNGSDPCIVSGQGTQNVVINFGSLGEHYRVICIPYDANPGTLAAPSDACYASLAYFPTSPALPVNLTFFRAIETAQGIRLIWQTASESNNDYFLVEQGGSPESFNTIGKVPGAGNSNHLSDYSFDVPKLYNGENYFRITQVDYDGTATHSDVVSVINESPEAGITLFSKGNTLVMETASDILYPLNLSVYDLMGRLLYKKDNIRLSAGESLNMDLPEGISSFIYLRLEGTGVQTNRCIPVF
jgi:hypothetical protein